jgi:hypothetical protein
LTADEVQKFFFTPFEFSQPALGKAPKILYTIDMYAIAF